jgi:solute carrier family 45 protein 1/2/4
MGYVLLVSLITGTIAIDTSKASRMAAIGHLFGYIIGSIDLVGIFGTFFGDTQFKQMTLLSAVSFLGCVLVTSHSVKERILISARLARASYIKSRSVFSS